jgi:ubiquinone/menaquinone biosynthesis C-methylase UbiE
MDNHKDWVAEIFDRAAPEYGRKSSSFFQYFGTRLVEQVKIPPGAHILDIATGRGAVLFPLAQAAGPFAKIIGIDISAEMIKETSKELLKQNFPSIELLCMDAEQLCFPDHTFDFVFCGFALFFFPSISAALSEFKRVLKPGGRLVVSTWGQDSELDVWVNEEIKKISHVKSLAISPLWSEKDLYQALANTNFKQIQIVEETKTFFHVNPSEWWESLWNHGTRAKFEQLSKSQIETLHQKALQKLSALRKEKGIAESLQVFYGIAQKAGSITR